MATRFHIGAKSLRSAIGAYGKRFDLLEVRVTSSTAPELRAQGASADAVRTDPSLATLRRWRKDVGPSFEFTVVGGPALSTLRPGEAFEKDLAAAQAAITALQARCFLLRTPSDVSPSPLWRQRMEALLSRFPRDVTQIAWEPSGVWEVDQAAEAAKKWGVVLVVDAARDPVPPGPVAYVRLRAMGETRSFGTAALERVLYAIGERRDAYVVIESENALKECKRLRQLSQEVRADGAGGEDRWIRPVGSLLGADEEE